MDLDELRRLSGISTVDLLPVPATNTRAENWQKKRLQIKQAKKERAEARSLSATVVKQT